MSNACTASGWNSPFAGGAHVSALHNARGGRSRRRLALGRVLKVLVPSRVLRCGLRRCGWSKKRGALWRMVGRNTVYHVAGQLATNRGAADCLCRRALADAPLLNREPRDRLPMRTAFVRANSVHLACFPAHQQSKPTEPWHRPLTRVSVRVRRWCGRGRPNQVP